MDREQQAQKEAASAEPRYDRQLAVMLEGVVDLELAAARRHPARRELSSGLVQRGLGLLQASEVPEHFLRSPFRPERHRRLLQLPAVR